MKKILISLLILLIVGTFFIYWLKRSDVSDKSQEDTEWHWPDSIKNILIIPDSLLFRGDTINKPMDLYTPEQKALAQGLATLMYKYTQVKDNRMIFEMSREEFLKTGIHEVYYDDLIYACKSMNDFMNNDTLPHTGSMADNWAKMKEEMCVEMDLDVE